MKSIELSSHLSLAYELGASHFSKEEIEKLYGVRPGEEIRGQNLKVNVVWENSVELQPSDFYQICQKRVKEKLKTWDHSFLKQGEGAFQARPLTLENISLSLAEVFQSYSAPKCLKVEVEQGPWRVKVDVAQVELITLSRQLRFQTLIKTNKGYEPIDLDLILVWSGALDRSSGLLRPWTELLKPVGQVYQSLRNEDEQYFEVEAPDIFLKKIAQRLAHEDSERLLSAVHFLDKKESYKLSFYSSTDPSENFS